MAHFNIELHILIFLQNKINPTALTRMTKDETSNL